MITLQEDITPSLVKTGNRMIIMVGADHCPYCQAIKPFFQTMSEVYPQILFYYLDSNLGRGIDTLVKIEGIPSLSSFHRGKLVSSKEGGNVDNVISILDELLEL